MVVPQLRYRTGMNVNCSVRSACCVEHKERRTQCTCTHAAGISQDLRLTFVVRVPWRGGTCWLFFCRGGSGHGDFHEEGAPPPLNSGGTEITSKVPDSVIGETLSVQGTVEFKELLRIDGHFEGGWGWRRSRSSVSCATCGASLPLFPAARTAPFDEVAVRVGPASQTLNGSIGVNPGRTLLFDAQPPTWPHQLEIVRPRRRRMPRHGLQLLSLSPFAAGLTGPPALVKTMSRRPQRPFSAARDVQRAREALLSLGFRSAGVRPSFPPQPLPRHLYTRTRSMIIVLVFTVVRSVFSPP